MIRISIIIPTYKRVDQTLKTLKLIFSADGFNKIFQAEIIVSDSSPDKAIKKAVGENFGNRVIYIKPEKPGIAANKNQGAKIAKNPILIFCDSDMEIEPETILNTLQALKKYPTAGAVGGQVIWRTGPKDSTNDRPRKEDQILTVNNITYTEALYSRYIATYKEIFDKVGGYDEEVFNMRGEGSDLSIRYWRAGYPLVYDDSIIVHHIHKTEGGIIRGVEHPEWGIAKDLLLLAYKYDINGQSKNFVSTVAANFEPLGKDGYWQILAGIKNHLDFIGKVKPIIDKQKTEMNPAYDFKFLEIFSQKELFESCIKNAESLILQIRNKALND